MPRGCIIFFVLRGGANFFFEARDCVIFLGHEVASFFCAERLHDFYCAERLHELLCTKRLWDFLSQEVL